jgi:hypothetical protein
MRSTLTARARHAAVPGRCIPPLPGQAKYAALAALTALLAIVLPADLSAQAERPADDPFARRAWSLELGSHGAVDPNMLDRIKRLTPKRMTYPEFLGTAISRMIANSAEF